MTHTRIIQFTIASFLVIFIETANAQETKRLFLSGHGKDDAVPWNFLCTTGAQSGFWTNIPVPSNWELHGFGTLNYRRDGTNPSPESGLYEHKFVVPPAWSGQRIFLVFDGAMTDTGAKLNGDSVGPIHQGSFYRFKYEVTPLVKFGATNQLAVTVAKHSTNNSVNRAERQADYWVFGGIYRPVYLEAVPQQFIERVAIDAKADGNFAMDVFTSGVTDADSVEAQITSLDGKKVGRSFTQKIFGDKAALQTKIRSPLQWTAETPNLYRVQVYLKRGKQTIHRIEQRFGFRTMEVREGDGLYVNGQKIILKGVNRHSFWPDSGRCLSEAVHRLDIETIKDMNGNAVRMSHYPPDAEFLDLCDELGLYVLDELSGWHNFYDTPTGTKLVKEMVTRDVNHPSILFWDNGNEGGFNTNLDKIFGEFDLQKRRVLHPWASFSGLCTMHYLSYDKAEIAAGGKSVYFKSPDKELVATNDLKKYIYMPTEFSHGLFDGGAGAGFEDYWRMMTSHTNCAGGFLWGLLDEGVKRPDTGMIDTASNQAPDGIVGPYREREGSYYAIKEIWSPIEVKNISLKSASATVEVKNNFAFTDTAECTFRWKFYTYGNPLESSTSNLIAQLTGVATSEPLSVLERPAASPVIHPGKTKNLKVRFPNWIPRLDALGLQVNDAAGRTLCEWTWPLYAQINFFPQTPVMARANRLGGINPGPIELRSSSLTVRVDQQSGWVTSIERDGKIFQLTDGPRAANTNCIVKNVSWQLRADGWLQCDFTYAANGTNDFIGVAFDYPENLVKSKSWLGNGPFRVWKNRLKGGTLNLWQNDYNNTITGYKDWIYPEFKGCFSDVRWLQLDTTEGKITVVPENIPFVQVLTPDFPPTNIIEKTFVNLPKCGLGFLHAIPPIGAKTKPAWQCGPQSQPNVAHGEYSGSVSFYFGELPASPPKRAAN